MNDKILNYIELTRIKRPIGIWLLFLPCLFGIFLALKQADLAPIEATGIIVLFGLGSAIMRSAGCVINDILDYKFDAKVHRTKDRPLAAGKISRLQALLFLGFLLLLGLLILLQFNQATIIAGFFALILVFLYPLMKRITYYPQTFLGLTFNFGILMAGFAILGHINLSFFILYLSAILWTLVYDTIYAYQDIEDDLKIGVKSSAIKFGKTPKKILLSLTALMFLGIFYVGFAQSFKIDFFIINFVALALLCHKIIKCDFDNSTNCLNAFKGNLWIGILILIGIILG